jgi:hypothetical protein
MSGFHAKELFKRSQESHIMTMIDEICRTIDEKIIDANKSGCATVEYDLPDCFTIDTLSRPDIQLVLYSRIITHFSERGFDVKLNKKSRITIKWVNMLDKTEKQKMMDIINKHLVD